MSIIKVQTITKPKMIFTVGVAAAAPVKPKAIIKPRLHIAIAN